MLFKGRDKRYASEVGEQIVYFAHEGIIRGEFILQYSYGIDERYIYDLQIYEEYRNQGYGNLMIAEMVEKYGNYKNLPLTLGVLRDNLPALHLNQKYGFKVYNDETPGVYWMRYERN